MPAGRPPSYKKSFAKQAEKLCILGATDAEVADFFGVSARTVYRWKLDHQEFCQALKAGKAAADERVERALYSRATGYDYVEERPIKLRSSDGETVEIAEVRCHSPADVTAAIFWLKNRRPDEWRDRREITGDPNRPIQISYSDPFAQLRETSEDSGD